MSRRDPVRGDGGGGGGGDGGGGTGRGDDPDNHTHDRDGRDALTGLRGFLRTVAEGLVEADRQGRHGDAGRLGRRARIDYEYGLSVGLDTDPAAAAAVHVERRPDAGEAEVVADLYGVDGDEVDVRVETAGDGAEVVVLADGREVGRVAVGDPDARVVDTTIRNRVLTVRLAVGGEP